MNHRYLQSPLGQMSNRFVVKVSHTVESDVINSSCYPASTQPSWWARLTGWSEPSTWRLNAHMSKCPFSLDGRVLCSLVNIVKVAKGSQWPDACIIYNSREQQYHSILFIKRNSFLFISTKKIYIEITLLSCHRCYTMTLWVFIFRKCKRLFFGRLIEVIFLSLFKIKQQNIHRMIINIASPFKCAV